MKYNITIFQDDKGNSPYKKWFSSLNEDHKIRILKRFLRIEQGNIGDYKSISNAKNLYELRFNFSPGYRIYYTMKGKEIIILLVGGDKSSQKKDISKAKKIIEEQLLFDKL